MKIIIVGCGKVGKTLAEQLHNEHHDITIIDSDAAVLRSVTENIDVMGVVGNGAISQIQLEAGIEDADLLIATTSSDEVNMLSCLIAKKTGNCHTIARVRNPEYSREVNFIREELNLSMAINPDLIAAKEIARLLKFPSAIKVDTFAKGRIDILKFVIPKNSILDQMKVFEVSKKLGCKVLICVIERENEVIIPTGNSEIKSGDIISFIAPSSEIPHFFKQAGIVNNAVKSIMIVGGSRITYYLAKMLEESKISVTIIEKDMEHCNELSEVLPSATIINGDGTSQQLLLEEGIRATEAFVALTGFDEENIMLSLYAASQMKGKLITKINRISFEEVINSMNLGSMIYPKLLTADYILRYVRAMQNSLGSNIETLYKIAGNKVEALEFRVQPENSIVGIPFEKIELKKEILVACINRKGTIIIPGGKDVLMAGDTVIIVTTDTGLNDLTDILK